MAKALIPREFPTSIAMLILEQKVNRAFLGSGDGVVLNQRRRSSEVAQAERWKEKY
jgi:hypothetical protein